MKKYISFLFVILIFCSCPNNSANTIQQNLSDDSSAKENTTKPTSPLQSDSMSQKNSSKIIGADKDEHGCIASAGYRWSEAKRECVRLFEVGIRLEPLESKSTDSLPAFLVFSDDKTKADLFLPNEKNSLLLLRTGKEGNYVWKNTGFEVFLWKGYMLRKNGKSIYHGE